MALKITFICKSCNKSFEDYISNKRSSFCSLPCYWKSKKGNGGYWIGKKRDVLTITKISATKIRKYKTGEVIHPRLGYRKWTQEEYRKIKVWFAHKRRAKIRGNGGTYSITEWDELKEIYNWTCPCCKKKEPEITLTIDHIVPISKGGLNSLENLQPLCKKCNISKGARHITKYIL